VSANPQTTAAPAQFGAQAATRTQAQPHANPLHTLSLKMSSAGDVGRGNSTWHQARAWQTNAGLLLIGGALLLLTRQLVQEYEHFTIGFTGVSGWSAWLYVAAIFLVLTQPVNRFTFPIILGVAIVCRLVPLYADPYLSSDIYRYVWDGIVQHSHISPYRYVPGDAALTFLRSPNQEIFNNINRRDYAHTIYPPVAQLLFYCITFISPTVEGMKTAMVLFEGLTVYALVRILTTIGLRREQALLYAWCPLLVWEVAGGGHLDSAAMAFIALSLLFRLQRRAALTGLFLGLAVMTKLYPIVLLPALLIPNEDGYIRGLASLNPKNWDWKLPATTFSVIAIGYAAYSSVGLLVFGFLGGYMQEEGIAAGTRYFFLELAQHIPGLQNLPTAVFYLFCVFTFSALSVWALRTSSSKEDLAPGIWYLVPATALAAALMLLFSPHYPWYVLWLIPFFTLRPNLPMLVYLMGVFYLFTTPLADGNLAHFYTLNKILYAAVAVAVLIYIALRNRKIPGISFQSNIQRSV
jgi:alpha-1,6-mannosyltransferase